MGILSFKSGSGGGALVTASDMAKLWGALMHYQLLYQLLNETYSNKLLILKRLVNEIRQSD
ncbi:hypothetical protein [Pontibacillus litoralis]|uniref:Uncharacterized protein n=1 Tax=Pontibacillus litoralis JSM 072002 TaxID=1385512 RepID=A0A0A5G3X7_9BACI|nr:hypothetical protein [Pontibacillus litoralis]KGX85795.1 hypothetical protein N784_08210 [Pontibacillus litoralis JSM 072002]